jgi:hypothetical protein
MNKQVVVLARQRYESQKGSAILRRSGIPPGKRWYFIGSALPAKAAAVAGCSVALSIKP